MTREGKTGGGAGQATCTEQDLRACFRLLLGREPGATEWDWHRWQVGHDLEGVVRCFLGSPEHKALGWGTPAGELPEIAELDGFRLCARREDLAIGCTILEERGYEPHVTRLVREVTTPGMRVLDIGANIGYFTFLCASLVGPTGEVVAVEPNPDNVRMLHASRMLNAASQVRILPCAATLRADLYFYDAQGSNGTIGPGPTELARIWSSAPVPGFPLDSLLGEDFAPDLVKIDVEGAEHLALSGALALLRRGHPMIFTEFSPEVLRTVSSVAPEEYLELLLTDPRDEIWVLAEDGGRFPCGRDTGAVTRYHEARRSDHIDLVVAPAGRIGVLPA